MENTRPIRRKIQGVIEMLEINSEAIMSDEILRKIMISQLGEVIEELHSYDEEHRGEG